MNNQSKKKEKCDNCKGEMSIHHKYLKICHKDDANIFCSACFNSLPQEKGETKCGFLLCVRGHMCGKENVNATEYPPNQEKREIKKCRECEVLTGLCDKCTFVPPTNNGSEPDSDKMLRDIVSTYWQNGDEVGLFTTLKVTFNNLKKEIQATREEERESIIDEIENEVEKYFLSLITKIPLPDPITMRDSIIHLLRERK